MDATDYTQRLSRNVLTLLPMSGLRTQRALADRVGWKDRGRLSRLLNGKQEWNLTDIVEIGQALGYHEDPFIITRPITEVIGAAGPNARATGTSALRSELTNWFAHEVASTVILFPQAEPPSRAPRVSMRPATVISLADFAASRHSQSVAV